MLRVTHFYIKMLSTSTSSALADPALDLAAHQGPRAPRPAKGIRNDRLTTFGTLPDQHREPEQAQESPDGWLTK